MNKIYQYKAYTPGSTTLYNRVWQGDFEGEFASTSLNSWISYWAGYNAGITIDRTRTDNRLGTNNGNAAVFNGVNSYIVCNESNGAAVDPFHTTAAASVFVTPNGGTWTGTPVMDIIGAYYMNAGLANGWGISMNFVNNNLSAIIGKGGANYVTADYPLASLSAGRHEIGMQYDGTTLRLYVDGVNVVSTASAGTIVWGGSLSLYGPTLGANTILNTGTTPTTNFFNGSMEQPCFYNFTGSQPVAGTPYPTSLFLNHFNNQSIQMAVSYNAGAAPYGPVAYTFDDLTSTATRLNDNIMGTFATPHNITVSTTSTIGKYQSVICTTSTGGAATQGLALSVNKPVITGGQTYLASAYVKAAVGKTLNLQIQPVGGGATTSTSVTSTGAWQRMQLNYVSNIAATNLEIDIFLSGANASIQTFYVDGVMLEDGSTLHDFYNKDSINVAGTSYSADYTNHFHYQVIETFTYVNTWTQEVVNNFSIAKEINNGGSQVTVVLARDADSFGERVDIDFNVQIQISVISNTYPNGRLVFTGFIADYRPIFGDKEQLEVTLLSYGDQLNQTMIESGTSAFYDQTNLTGTIFQSGYLGSSYIGQTFSTGDEAVQVSSITMWVGALVVGGIHPTVQVKIWDSLVGAQSDQFGNSTTKTYMAEAKFESQGILVSYITMTFVNSAGVPKPVQLSANTRYYVTLTCSNFGSGGITFFVPSANYAFQLGEWAFDNAAGGGGLYEAFPNNSLGLTINKGYGGTKVAYNSTDPSDMLRSILDDYARQGGLLGYDDTTIEDTGTITSYTFNTNTVYEGLQQVLAMTPAGWYFYIDQANNMVHLHPSESATVHTLTLGKDLQDLDLLKRTESIVNAVYFTGGPDPADSTVNLYRLYTNAESIALYGKHILKYTDNRVTQTDTMDLIAGIILEEKSSPEIQTTIDIIDGNYDLELINPGDIIQLRGITNGGTSSLWDVAKFDEDYWDFDVATPETMSTQIARFTYKPDMITTTLNTTPPDVNKRVEDIKRNLDTTQVQNNPSVAES